MLMAKVRFEQNWIKAKYTINTCINCVGGSLVNISRELCMWVYLQYNCAIIALKMYNI